jgi:hypothetical protein
MCHEHKRLSSQARPIADVLTAVNNLSGNNLWTKNEISDVSNKITTDLFGNFSDIVDIAIGRPSSRKSAKPIELYYTNNVKVDNDSTHGHYRLTGRKEVDTISFESIAMIPNNEQGINDTAYLEGFQLLKLEEDNDASNSLRAYAVYYDDSAAFVSSSDYAWYLVVGANGIFRGAKRVKIDFYKDRTRKVTVRFD